MRRLLVLLLTGFAAAGQQPGFDVATRAPRAAQGRTATGEAKPTLPWRATPPERPLPAPAASPELRSSDPGQRRLGNLNLNPYDPDSVSNPYGRYGSPYSPDSIHNPYGVYGSPYSPYSVRNPYTTRAPAIVAPDGKFLGRFGSNPFDPDSTANPYGRYGSPYSPDSIQNFYGPYGSPYSPSGVRNPMGTGSSSRSYSGSKLP